MAASAGAEGANKSSSKSASGGGGKEELEIEGGFGVDKEVVEARSAGVVDARTIDFEFGDSGLDTAGDGDESAGGGDFEETVVLR